MPVIDPELNIWSRTGVKKIRSTKKKAPRKREAPTKSEMPGPTKSRSKTAQSFLEGALTKLKAYKDAWEDIKDIARVLNDENMSDKKKAKEIQDKALGILHRIDEAKEEVKQQKRCQRKSKTVLSMRRMSRIRVRKTEVPKSCEGPKKRRLLKL